MRVKVLGNFEVRWQLPLDGVGVVHVLDAGNLKVSSFRTTREGLEHLSDTRLEPWVDLCLVGARRFVLRPMPEGVVHEVDSTGAAMRSFGEPVSTSVATQVLPPDLQFDLLSRGHLACAPALDRVVHTFERLGRVAMHDASGSRIWDTQLSDFIPVRFERSERGGYRMALDPEAGRGHTVKAVAVHRDGRDFVTVHEAARSNVDGQLTLRVLDGLTGREVQSIASEASWVAVRGDTLYGYRDHPYPQVVKVLSR